MTYTYNLFWRGMEPLEVEENDNLLKKVTSSIPVEVGHHIENTHGVAEVKAILHNLLNEDTQLVVEMICTVEEYGIR